jgi:competence protein ComGC
VFKTRAFALLLYILVLLLVDLLLLLQLLPAFLEVSLQVF